MKIDRLQAFLCWVLRCHKPTWGCWRGDGCCCICGVKREDNMSKISDEDKVILAWAIFAVFWIFFLLFLTFGWGDYRVIK
jgi:hypothetical protein